MICCWVNNKRLVCWLGLIRRGHMTVESVTQYMLHVTLTVNGLIHLLLDPERWSSKKTCKLLCDPLLFPFTQSTFISRPTRPSSHPTSRHAHTTVTACIYCIHHPTYQWKSALEESTRWRKKLALAVVVSPLVQPFVFHPSPSPLHFVFPSSLGSTRITDWILVYRHCLYGCAQCRWQRSCN